MNIREVLEIAVTMESDGIAFYAKAADFVDNSDAKKVLLELSEWEKSHYADFEKIRDEVVARSDSIVNPDGDAMLYLKSLVTGAIFDSNSSPVDFIKPDSTPASILKKAISLEKDAICCYSGIRMIMADKFSIENIDRIIKEEMEHVRILTNELNKLAA